MPDTSVNSKRYRDARPYFRNLRSFKAYCGARDDHERNVCTFCPEHLNLERNKPFAWPMSELQGWHNPFPYPGTRIHAVISPKRHIIHPSQMTAREKMELWEARAWVETQFDVEGACFMGRHGNPDLSGMSVMHLHFHVVVPEHGKAVVIYLSKSEEGLAEAERNLLEFERRYAAGERE